MTAERPRYSSAQVSAYFDRLELPETLRNYDVSGLSPADALAYLTLLQKHQLVAIPFENLTLHYSAHHQVSLHHDELFKKIISDGKGRGGYCMENNCLFGTLLRSLGFQLYSAGARVWEGSQWTGWSHMINFVTVGNQKYHVDVGFGSNGPIIPMPLDTLGTVQRHISPATARLQWRNISGNTDPNQYLWVYEHCIDKESDFSPMYCFTELEFLPNDYNLMNYFTSTSPKTFFTRTLIGDKKIMDENGELVGNIILGHKDMKWRVRGKKEREVYFGNEEERLKAIEEHFDIRLGQVEKEGIRGMASELK